MTKRLSGIFFFLLFVLGLQAQNIPELTINLVGEKEIEVGNLSQLNQQIQEEIKVLLANRQNVIFTTKTCECDQQAFQAHFDQVFADQTTDIIIAVGPMASAVLAQQPSFRKPAIAALIIDHELQNVAMTPAETSGKDNFTYIQSPFSFEKDLALLHKIYPFENIGVLTTSDATNLFPNFQDLFKKSGESLKAKFTPIIVGKDAATTLDLIPGSVDAFYVFPAFEEFGATEYPAFFKGLADMKLPSVALLGESMVELGAMVGYESGSNIAKMPRRVALDVAKIVEGTNAADLPVRISTFGETAIINMNTVRAVDKYPSWDLLTESLLLHEYDTDAERSLNLKTMIMEALDKNLTLRIAEKDPLIAQQETMLAKSELLPQLDINTSLVLLDDNTAGNSFGTKGRLNWMAGSSLSQIVYAEPALANVAIQELLQQGEENGLQVVQLDVVLDAANAYLSVLQAKRFMEIKSANVNVTKNNLDIARAKDAVGYSGAADLNRWTSELALAKIDLKSAQAQFQQAKFALNQFLNHPIADEFQSEDIDFGNDLLLINDTRLLSKINNQKEADELADFLVEEALTNLPELKQLGNGLAAQERLLKSNERAFFLPSVAVSGGWDRTLKRWDVTTSNGLPIPDNMAAWNLGVGVQYPILQGGQRKANQEKTQLNILQIQDQQADLRNQLELRVRAALETASASYFSVLQYRTATKAASDNYKLVQDSYSQGLVSITNLVDAQNAKLQTELGAANASYQFILDFLEVERSTGAYYLLANDAERTAFFERLNLFLTKK